mmetsp:Transcript_50805/g.75294  ORF Transcript_50805/g.75294 Transcript_50805/m.75294 type:complete len:177 (+) Transcript_50805:99-629(+)|eukprot:CAMPEP_0195526816 /NCGR_PEP_ID=MMETSP0794_2-20130614/28130_1 /TAXON_ID=515487 /ORGANISM="Stephanopyxis turris, Strain CCMP 815" /LENGTH=176 /DNA_ID=CAMNT_0040657601 /DNA_START=99 /DNA_END=629 /DNA_ORIENTATION=+
MLRAQLLFIWLFSCVAAFSNSYIRSRSSCALGARRQVFMSAALLDLTDSNHEELFGGDKPVLIDAYAPWCGPCKLIEPVVSRCAKEWNDSLVVTRYDVDAENPKVKMAMLLDKVIFSKLPSLVLYHKGKAIASRSGLINDDQLDDFLKVNLRVTKPEKQSGSGFVNFGSMRDDYAL